MLAQAAKPMCDPFGEDVSPNSVHKLNSEILARELRAVSWSSSLSARQGVLLVASSQVSCARSAMQQTDLCITSIQRLRNTINSATLANSCCWKKNPVIQDLSKQFCMHNKSILPRWSGQIVIHVLYYLYVACATPHCTLWQRSTTS